MSDSNSSFKKRVLLILKQLKSNLPSTSPSILPIWDQGKVIANLRVISFASVRNKNEIKLMALWRKRNSRWFPAIFRVTLKGTKRWAHSQLLEMPERILFMVEDLSGREIGHMGLYRFNFSDKSCEIDNVIRGKMLVPGVMTLALKTLINWSYSVLQVKNLYLRVFSDNKKAISFYERCGFKEIEKIPLQKKKEGATIRWKECPPENKTKAERYFLRMKFAS
ncbi:MAG: GNAT family N-acetyltransferase [Patescibacteria group bacterium]